MREAIRWLYAVILAHQYVVLFVVVAIEEAGLPLRACSPAVFAAASIYWSIWVAVGVIFGPAVRAIIGPAYIRLFLIALPLAVVTFFIVRYVRARRRASSPLRRG